MGRPKGSKNRKLEDRTEALLAYGKSVCRGAKCSRCKTEPIKGVVIPGLHEWVRKSTATLADLQKMIAENGLWCRSCLGKASRAPKTAALLLPRINAMLPGIIQEAFASCALDGETQCEEPDNGALAELEARMAELGKCVSSPSDT